VFNNFFYIVIQARKTIFKSIVKNIILFEKKKNNYIASMFPFMHF